MTGSIDRHQRVRAIYEAIRDLPPDARAATLAEACGDDSGLRHEVVGLVEAEAQMGMFLERGVGAALPAPGHFADQRVGPYEVKALLGAGGMGEVYQAHDTRLRRNVALKILPDLFRDDAERTARLRREAQLLASLNHANIAAVYGLEDSSRGCVLVMELVPGPTLADRLASGPIPLEESLNIARQLVDALDAAHQRGVVHRDLKPANVKVRDDGTVKVLDFGLAKLIEPPRASSDDSSGASSAHGDATREGVVLGTPGYMSPEQEQGRAIDTRTDIWAFGCILAEMLTGRRSFGEFDAGLLPSTMPPSLRRLLVRCLAREPKRRLADIADARFELDETAVWMQQPSEAAAGTTRGAWSRWLPWAIATVAVVAAIWLASARIGSRSSRDSEVLRSSILVPGRLVTQGTRIALSPDGTQLALIALAADGRPQLWIRHINELTPLPIPGTVNARTPFWSVDSQWVAFVQDGKLRKVPAAGGEPVTLCDGAAFGGSWNAQNLILFTSTSQGIAVVSGSGGTASPVTHVDARQGDSPHVSPAFLSDGRRFLYVRLSVGDEPQVYLRSLDSSVETAIPIAATTIQVTNDLLWFVRGTTLMAQPFDLARGTVVGAPTAVAEQIHVDPAFLPVGVFSVSTAGLLTFQSDPSPGSELVWYNRRGEVLGTLGTRADYADTAVSPDGRRVIVSVRRGDGIARDLWLFDAARGIGTRLTFDDTRIRRGAIWSRNGTSFIYTAQHNDRVRIVRRRVDGVGEETVLFEDQFDKELASESPDGRFLLYHVRRGGGPPPAVWVLPLTGERKPVPFSQPLAFLPQISPDGRWATYMSAESGRMEVYVTSFPQPGSKTRISSSGGIDAVWRGDGREIIYFANNQMMSAAVAPVRDTLHVGEVRPLFQYVKTGPRRAFDITADAERILAVARRSEAASVPLTLVANWPALIRQSQ
jgi:eukaryotic-like serine/threonine-protein kinase